MQSIPHLTPEQIEVVIKRHEEAMKFFESVKADHAAKQLYENPGFSLNQIITTLSMLKKETDSIFNAPPPAPKKAEEPKPAEGSAGAMKEGEPEE